MAVYGEQEPPFTEDKRPQPIDPYGIAKYAVECDLKLANEQFGLRYNIVRPHNVLGIYQNIWDKYRNVIGIFIRKTLNGEPILVYGDGEQTRDFVYVKDIVNANIIAADRNKTNIFNIASGKQISIYDLAKLIMKITGKNLELVYKKSRIGDIIHSSADISKAKNILGYKPKFPLNIGLKETINWFKGYT